MGAIGSSCGVGCCVWRKPWRKVHVISKAFMLPLAVWPYGRGRAVGPEKSDDYVKQNAGSITAGCDGINMTIFNEELEENL
jgi:hypothetical protein